MYRLFLAAALTAPAVSAQGVSPFALPVLPASAHEAGVAQTLAVAPSDNPYVLRHNPAFLADHGERPAFRFATSVAPMVFENDDLLIGSSAASIGIAAGEIGGGDFQIGLGGSYAEYRIDRLTGASGSETSSYGSEEREIGGALALGWDGPVNVRIGGAAFSRESIETPVVIGSPLLDRDRVVTMDVGGAVSYPLMPGPSQPGERASQLDLTGAFVYHNITLSEDFFVRPDDPPLPTFTPAAPPESQTVGLGARYALVRQLGRRGEFRLVEAGVSVQNESVSDDADRRGIQASVILAEIIAFRAGHSQSTASNSVADNSVGAELRIGGLIRAIGAARESASMLALADRTTMRFEVAVKNVDGELPRTTFYGLTLGWRP